jgi:excisionase family DNA binding protein
MSRRISESYSLTKSTKKDTVADTRRPEDGQMHDVRLVAHRLRVSDKTVQRLIAGGKINTYRVGRQIRISKEQLIQYLTDQKT